MAWCLPDEADPQADAVMATVAAQGAVVPVVWHWEVANVFALADRRGRLAEGLLPDLLAQVAALGIVPDEASPVAHWQLVITLANRHRLSVYDAAYLELAMRRALPLASLDKALRRAAEAEGVEVLPAH